MPAPPAIARPGSIAARQPVALIPGRTPSANARIGFASGPLRPLPQRPPLLRRAIRSARSTSGPSFDSFWPAAVR
jgi:hypothetical protein